MGRLRPSARSVRGHVTAAIRAPGRPLRSRRASSLAALPARARFLPATDLRLRRPPAPGSAMAGTRRAAHRPRDLRCPPRAAPRSPAAPVLPAPGRRGIPRRTRTAAKLQAGCSRAWRLLRQRLPGRPGPERPGSRRAGVGAAGQSLGLRRSPRFCFRLLALPPALTVKGGPAGGAAAWG